MTKPRQILPGTTYKVSRCVAHKQELFKEDCDDIKAIFMYCFAYASKKSSVKIHAFSVLPGRYYAVVSDPEAKLPVFMHYLNRNVAKAVNATRVENESVFVNGKYKSDVLEGKEEVGAAVKETLEAPVAMGHKKSLSKWEGLWSKPSMVGRKIKAKRPTGYFSEDGHMPAELDLVITPPPCFGEQGEEAYRQELTIMVDPARARLGVESEEDRERRRRIRARKMARARAYRMFVRAYRRALRLWRDLMRGRDADEEVDVGSAVFPCGTYWMRCFCHVECQV